MKDTDFEIQVEGTEVLPDMIGDAIGVEDVEELFAENTGEGEGDIAEEDIRRSVVCVALVEDVGEEGVCRVKGLPARLACPLGRGEEVVLVDLFLQFEEEALLP